ncbi:hypothetical protein BDP67DRAFT_243718 [Colletotrichum lupini]|nr:hypothetical protein BDP67DRAFT_243718 [Colletotrichum lupini]
MQQMPQARKANFITIAPSPSHRHHHRRHLFHRFISNSQTQLERNEINVVHHSSSKRGTQTNQLTPAAYPPLLWRDIAGGPPAPQRNATPVPQIRLATTQKFKHSQTHLTSHKQSAENDAEGGRREAAVNQRGVALTGKRFDMCRCFGGLDDNYFNYGHPNLST